jgi:ABC-type dipeptide/oligopeptide/nickel transport system permease subunit
LRFAKSGSGALGLALVVVVLALVLIGPLFSPHDPAESLGMAGTSPDSAYPLGLDKLGRDVLSRLLWGGRSVIGLAAAATLACYGFGMLFGVTAGYNRRLEGALMRSVDVIRAFPPLLFFLIIVTALGTSVWVLILGVTVVQAPGIARLDPCEVGGHAGLSRDRAQLPLRPDRPAMRGRSAEAGAEDPPEHPLALIADAGLRFTFSILLVASVNFLGLGLSRRGQTGADGERATRHPDAEPVGRVRAGGADRGAHDRGEPGR